MIRLSNGHSFEYMTASGALGFEGKGWFWEEPLVWAGLIRPELFTIVLRTLTFEPRLYPTSNLSWIRPWTWLPWSPYSCVQLLPNGGVVNKVGLYNPGIHSWCQDIGPTLDYDKYSLVSSIYGTEKELVAMTKLLNGFDFKAIEINVSCPNTGHESEVREIVSAVHAVKKVSRLPLILKLSEQQECEFIARSLENEVEAISLNSVQWDRVYVNDYSPMEQIGHDKGKGGVSGKPAQYRNWAAVGKLLFASDIPIIAPGIMEYEDMEKARDHGAEAVSFGAIHLRTPWKPTSLVLRELRKTL